MTQSVLTDPDSRPRLLLVDDDVTFCKVLAEALEKRGYSVVVAHDVAGGLKAAEQDPPEFAVIDLKMPGPSGLELIERLKALDEHTRIVVLTGYASIATAVHAVKLGATQYITKPADADEIVAGFYDAADAKAPVGEVRLSPTRLEWEYIQKVLLENNQNISATARKLGMHRRTLQRKLSKHPVRR